MSIPLPNLDDRRWIDLVEEGRALIPLHAPEWTDHNVHDPGITLMELFAWIAEMDIYELNRVPDRHKLKFLALVGIVPEPPRAARTVLSFSLAPGAPDPLPLRAGTEFVGQDPFGDETRFRTVESIAITHARLLRVFRTDRQGEQDLTERWRRSAAFEPFGPAARRGTECCFAFSQAFPAGLPINLFFTFEGDHANDEAREDLLREMQERARRCSPSRGPSCEPIPPPPQIAGPPGRWMHHSVRLVWEYFGQRNGGIGWIALDPRRGELDDDTRAFTLNGRIRITLPGPLRQHPDGAFLIRCRVEAGSYDGAPVILNLILNGVAAEQAVPVGSIKAIATENLEAVQLGLSDGTSSQQFKLSELPEQEDGFRNFTPIQEISFRLFTLQSEEWHEWQKRADFDAAGRDDAHYVLDPSAGTVTFGDGEHGRVPAKDAVIYATYQATRSEAGNLAANTVQTLADSLHNRAIFGGGPAVVRMQANFTAITNPVPALGGAAAESLPGAEARAIERMETSPRAVTLSDFKRLALVTPGVRLARVEALVNAHPSFPCVRATGLVTLIIFPYLPKAAPKPSPGLRQAVAAYLARRRIIGTRVEVVEPTYLEVGVRAKVRSAPMTDKSAIQQRIVQALDTFFHPLEGGPDRAGWPLGRDVYRSEVLQVIDQVGGVEHVLAMDLMAAGGEPQCGNICLSPTWLTIAGKHQIEVL